jgi:hypothetical protein
LTRCGVSVRGEISASRVRHHARSFSFAVDTLGDPSRKRTAVYQGRILVSGEKRTRVEDPTVGARVHGPSHSGLRRLCKPRCVHLCESGTSPNGEGAGRVSVLVGASWARRRPVPAGAKARALVAV